MFFVNSLTIDNTDANVTCSKSSYMAIKLATKDIEWMPSTFNEKKIILSGGLSLLTAIKCNISFLSIGELSKILPIAFHDSKTYCLAFNKCPVVNKF